MVTPTAIVAIEEKQQDTVPFKILGWFDPSEPLFQQSGLHPAVIYRKVAVIVGNPIAISDLQQQYHGKQAGKTAIALTDTCHSAVASLLQVGCY